MKKNRLPYQNKTGFQIPEGYLDDLEERLLAKVTPLMGDSPLWGKAEKPFAVPENYFDSLEDRIMDAVQGQEKKEPKVISLIPRDIVYYVAGVAAVLLAIVSITSEPQPASLSLENLDLLSLENYLEESFDYGHPEVAGYIAEDDFSFATPTRSHGIDQEAVIEYLHENIEEPSLIFNEN